MNDFQFHDFIDNFEDDDNLIDFLYTKFITADLIRKPNLNIQKNP